MSALPLGTAPLLPSAVGAALGRPIAYPTSHVAIVGPGGSGKSVLLGLLTATWSGAAPGRVLRGPDDQRPGMLGVRIVDDAHLLDPATLDRLAAEAQAGQPLVLAARPVPDAPALDRLLALTAAGTLIDLEPWPLCDVAEWAGPTADAATLLQSTGGLPWAVTAEDPATLAARCRALTAALPLPVLEALHGLAAGVTPDAGALDPDTADALWASGLLDAGGRLPDAVRGVVLGDVPQHRLRRLRRSALAGIDANTPPAALLELARGGASDERLLAALQAAGDAHLVSSPTSAAALYAAASAGIGGPDLRPRQAEAALRSGDLVAATGLVEEMLTDETLPDPQRTLPVILAVLVRRGMADSAAELCRWHDPELTGPARDVAAFVLVLTGHREEACALLERPSASAPTLFDGVSALLHEGLTESLRPEPAGAVATMVRAAEAASLATAAPVLPDCPAVVAALVALHAGEVDVAESLLRPAVARAAGLTSRVRLVLGWTLLMGGDQAGAEAELRAVGDPGELDTRDAFWAAALECGLARRAEDPHRLRASWAAARDTLLRQPVDLLGLLPLAELQLVATRLHADADLTTPLQSAWELLDRLGGPVLWAAPLHWAGVQAAILANRPPGVAPHARQLVAASGGHRYAATLADAGKVWMRVLGGEVDTDAVLAVSSALVRVGQAWEGRRLLGHAAARCDERRDSALLLDAARRVAETRAEVTPDPGARLTTLSPREAEVARLVLAGRTYAEIGRTLYLSARTVEHHVARIKRRIGAENRPDLLARLRGILPDA